MQGSKKKFLGRRNIGVRRVFATLIAFAMIAQLMSGFMFLSGSAEDTTEVTEQLSLTENEKKNNQEAGTGSDAKTDTQGETTQETKGEESPSEVAVIFDEQPQTMEEIQVLIDKYKELLTSNPQEAFDSGKPRWQYEVDAALMPEGYECIFVDYDVNFGENYYTFKESGAEIKPTALGDFSGGDGSASNPYQIATEADLRLMSDYVNGVQTGSSLQSDYAIANYIQTADIDLTNSPFFNPIGTSPVDLMIRHTWQDGPRNNINFFPFRGTYNGNGKKITNMSVRSGSLQDYKGMFGLIDSATIVGVTLDTPWVEGGAATAALVGYARGEVKIDNCKVNNAAIGSGNYGTGPGNFGIGGLIGVYDMDESSFRLPLSLVTINELTVTNCVVNNIGFKLANASASLGAADSDTRMGALSTGAGGAIGMIRANGSQTELIQTSGKVRVDNIQIIGDVSIEGAGSLGGAVGAIYQENVYGNDIRLENIIVGTSDKPAVITRPLAGRDYAGLGGVVGTNNIYGGKQNSVSIEAVAYATLNEPNVDRVGGILGAGYMGASGLRASEGNYVAIENSAYTGTASGYTRVGGGVGSFEILNGGSLLTKDNEFRIDGLTANATVRARGNGNAADGSAGGIVGSIHFYRPSTNTNTQDVGNTANISNATASGSVRVDNTFSVGGVAGLVFFEHSPESRANFDNCHSSSSVTSTSPVGYYVGGFLGYGYIWDITDKSAVTIAHSSASGDVNASHYYAGGFVGYLENTVAVTDTNAGLTNWHITDSYATGNVYGGSYYNGGFAGHTHGGGYAERDNVVIERCWSTGDVFGDSYYNGGFAGHPTNGTTFKECYATGDVFGRTYRAGGFAGHPYGALYASPTRFENCYATGNVYSPAGEVGGFVGHPWGTEYVNCYSVGSARGTGPGTTGGFAGTASATNTFENCFASGTVSSGRGFIGTPTAQTTAKNCYFDTTTTTQATPGMSGVIGMKTEDMLDPDKFNSWDIKNLWHVSLSDKSRGTDNPWYIDKGATYPYLYYQADGYDTTGDGKGDGFLDPQQEIPTDFDNTNYFLGVLFYDDGSGEQVLNQMRYDFEFDTAKSLSFNAMTVGAERAYFPYAYGTTATDYNKHQFWFEDGIKNSDTDGPDWVNTVRSGRKSFAAKQKISFGSYSKTNIVAFSAGPVAIKTNDSPDWETGSATNSAYKTFIGHKITYNVEFTNYSNVGDWKGIEMEDPLAKGVTLVNDFVFLYDKDGDETHLKNYTDIPEANRPKPQSELPQGETAEPYFTYEEGTGTYVGRYILKLFNLPELEYAKVDKTTQTMIFDTYDVQFVAQVTGDALTPSGQYPENMGITRAKDALKNYPHDNIRNRGNVTGTMHLWNPQFLFEEPPRKVPLLDGDGNPITYDVDIPIDDKDKDPVYFAYLIQYNSNHSNVIAGSADDVLDKDYLTSEDNNHTHRVIPNDDPNDPSTKPHERKDYTGFDVPSDLYDFDGWFYFKNVSDQTAFDNRDKANDPAATTPPEESKIVLVSLEDIDNGTILSLANPQLSNRDIVLYAKWKLKGVPFDFYKIDQGNDPLANVEFDLYKWDQTSAPGAADQYVVASGTGANVGNGKWVKQNREIINPYVSDIDGLVSTFLQGEGIFNLVETIPASAAYYLPEVQWRMKVETVGTELKLSDPQTIKRADDVYSIDFFSKMENGEKVWYLRNYLLNSIKAEKFGDEKQLLDGAIFNLERYIGTASDPSTDTNDSNWELIASGETGKDGNSKGTYQFGKVPDGSGGMINGLAPGSYRLKETKAPEGYAKLKKPVYINAPFEDDLSSLVEPELSQAKGNADYKYVNGSGTTIYGFKDQTYSITDAAEFTMPEAGARKAVFGWMLISGLFAIAASLYLWRLKSKKIRG